VRGRTALAVCLAGGVLAPAAASAEPISLRVHAPERAAAHTAFDVRVAVVANAGALDIAAKPLRLQVRLAPACGATFAGTEGPTVMNRKLEPPPVADVRYDESFTGRARAGLGSYSLCAFLVQHGDGRQFATSVDTPVDVTKRCTKATRKLDRLERKLRHADPSSRPSLRHRVRAAKRAEKRACD
jgi:hypothetical protein